ncbi:MAG: hypothetical protein M3155_04215 [Actinomycetota bacterium]|nr:hypothetical protein [Actinomycetota bacterium]
MRADEARAAFDGGILRVELPLAQREARGRRVPIDVPGEDSS